MKLKEQSILFFTRTMQLGGTENVILQMCEILKPYTKKIVVCSCGGINVTKLKEMGIKHYTIPDIGDKSFRTIFKVFIKIYKIIKNEKISIVHTHHRMATFYMHFFKKFSKIKLISTLHGSFCDKKRLTRIAYKNIDIIACGTTVKEIFVNNYKIDEKRIIVINNAVKKDINTKLIIDLNDFNLNSYKRIAYIGRLSKEKGISILIEAMPEIIKSIEKVCLFIVGEGPLENELRNKTKKLNIEKNIIFLGYQNEIQNIIRQVDLVVLPSYTEGLPLIPIEAFANSKPVVATAAGGTVDIINNNENGFLVPVGNSKLLADRIQEVLKNEQLYKKMCKEAYKCYENNYTYAAFKKKILEFYKKIVEEKNEE